MTKKNDLKQLVRARMAKTGESYTAALRHIRVSQSSAPAHSTSLVESEQVFSHSLFPYLEEGHATLVPKGAPEYGPYAKVRVVPDAQLEGILASGEWRVVTEAEVTDALDAEFSAFEDYGSEHEFFS